MKSNRFSEAITGYLFIMPWVIGFLAFNLIPLVLALFYSFTDYAVIGDYGWVGLRNYRRVLFEDPLFWKSLYNTCYFVLFTVPVIVALGLTTALLLNQRVRGRNLFRAIFYLPSVIPFAANSLLWLALLDTDVGLVNFLIGLIGTPKVAWLASELWSKPAIILMTYWTIGRGMIIYLAGLQDIPKELYEAAELDGSGRISQFFSITLPMITPVLYFDLLMGVIHYFQVFVRAFIMTDGGPLNSTLFYSLYLYNNAFRYFKMGYASALAWILFLIILGFTILIMKTSERWVFYRGG